MKIAVIGSGISGLTSAYYLSREHEVQVFEYADRIGGHTATIDVDHNGEQHAIDTGFIVYNDWTYPRFIELLSELGVASRPAEMSFSVSCLASGLEYAGSNFNTLFADRLNLTRIQYWRMLLEIVRFNRQAINDLESNCLPADESLSDYLVRHKFSRMFKEKYLIPMGAAIWSSGTDEMLDFPLIFFVRFFKNHGLLSIKNRPQWRTIVGGSGAYLAPLTEGFKDGIHTNTEITKISRTNESATVTYRDRETNETREQQFDALVVATHSDQALELLEDATAAESEILSGIPYQANEVVLHTDVTLLPKQKRAWSSWNSKIYRADAKEPMAKLSYNMNILQGIDSDTTYCVSLNQTRYIDPEKILGAYQYSHPVFSLEGVRLQQRWSEISGKLCTWYCGAYWGSGFHEDGVVSGLKVVESINKRFSAGNTPDPAAAQPRSRRREPIV